MMDTTDWQLVKPRTADADGAVYVSADGRRYRRTGSETLSREAAFQQRAAAWGYPVPHVLQQGRLPDGRFFVDEESVGEQSLHETALATAGSGTELADDVVDELAAVSSRLLTAQTHHPAADAGTSELQGWVQHAGWTDNVLTENPDLDTPRLRAALARAVDDVAGMPLVWGHLDYGLPNVLPGAVIDWQHHGLAPLGYDVALALEVIPFKGGAKGYVATPQQRTRYLAALDTAARAVGAPPVSPHLGAFLLVKSLFFLASMRPTDPARVDKHQKWQYRRHLVLTGVEQYERTGTIDTALFPTLDEFAAGQGAAGRP
ncbi:phosphotransferase [Streptomyces rubiginosohelvolus]|uniref:phosphotransferase n=1 Tax=Streptomyces rubiginosohelvolus TaxID=67362 RepID=UPI0037241756